MGGSKRHEETNNLTFLKRQISKNFRPKDQVFAHTLDPTNSKTNYAHIATTRSSIEDFWAHAVNHQI
jgi:hypothetical protein